MGRVNEKEIGKQREGREGGRVPERTRKSGRKERDFIVPH